MENKLTKEEVLHVARLARIRISDEKTLEKYQYQLKELLDSIETIKEVVLMDEEMIFTSVEHNATPSPDKVANQMTFQDAKKNIPRVKGNFIEVPVMIHE